MVSPSKKLFTRAPLFGKTILSTTVLAIAIIANGARLFSCSLQNAASLTFAVTALHQSNVLLVVVTDNIGAADGTVFGEVFCCCCTGVKKFVTASFVAFAELKRSSGLSGAANSFLNLSSSASDSRVDLDVIPFVLRLL